MRDFGLVDLGQRKLALVPHHYLIVPAGRVRIALCLRHMLFNGARPLGRVLVVVAQVPAVAQARIGVVERKAPFAVEQQIGIEPEHGAG